MGSSKSRKTKDAKKNASKKKKKQKAERSQPKPSPPSPVPSVTDSTGEQRSRRSLRIGSTVVVDFKALSSRGRDYLAQSGSGALSSAGGTHDFSPKQTFASYDELMRFTKRYEKEQGVRLNASMITPDTRPVGMPDWDYYRFVTFWCNFDPYARNNSTYTPIIQRYCPFYVRVAGDATRGCLAVHALSPQPHTHSVDPPGPILAAPPLPALLEGQNLSEDPASVIGAGVKTKAAPRNKLGRVAKPRVRPRPRPRKRKRPPLAALVPFEVPPVQDDFGQAAVPPKSPKKSPRSKTAVDDSSKKSARIKATAEDNSKNQGPSPQGLRTKSPRTKAGLEDNPKKSPRTKGGVEDNSKKSPRSKAAPEENPKCALCDFLCHSTEELVGHTWLRHQILTETWDLQ